LRRPTPRRLLPLGAGVRASPLVFLPTDFCGSPTEGGATEAEKKRCKLRNMNSDGFKNKGNLKGAS